MQLIHASDEMKRGKIPSLLNLDYDAIMVEYKILHYFLPIKPRMTNLKNKRVNTSCHQTETEKWLHKENSLPLSTKVEQTGNFNSSIKYFQSICHDLKFICPFCVFTHNNIIRCYRNSRGMLPEQVGPQSMMID